MERGQRLSLQDKGMCEPLASGLGSERLVTWAWGSHGSSPLGCHVEHCCWTLEAGPSHLERSLAG